MREPAYDFAARIDQDIEALSAEQDQKPSLTHRGKKLIEEYLPLSRFALSLKVPGLNVGIETTVPGAEEDGIIYLTGFVEKIIRVQIAYMYSHNESLRDEALQRYGVTFGSGPISRLKNGEIMATPEVEDMDAPMRRVAAGAVERYEKKRTRYCDGMYLLIAFADIRIYGDWSWAKVRELIDSSGGFKSGPFQQVWLCNCTYNQLRRFI
ncbi:hypothetical protein E4T66_08645 [Sinimarinibacterium sp. CAU 1509]|uniref:hypothetical protein n=1 Tax=Sinimarinibacterium sp. CAU 1509 TaxID=2562283 RepID=UPI0010AC8CF4|nr:hypothetical protein [Sinimarinibacterium sp. CAU 1509]TJY62278.1 hypothetical protein E4T66_08645 [Sinimarinibacterium sp. CAU 1509]